MPELGFKIDRRPYGDHGYIDWLIRNDGKRRRATDEEVALWHALLELTQGHAGGGGEQSGAEAVEQRRPGKVKR